jgi:hypothetical protein
MGKIGEFEKTIVIEPLEEPTPEKTIPCEPPEPSPKPVETPQ